MTIRIKKLDGRNTGYGKFKYAVESQSLHSSEFYDLRKWMWDTWGASKELKEWIHGDLVIRAGGEQLVSCQNENWCWQNDEYHRRLYLRTDKELVIFKLRWE